MLLLPTFRLDLMSIYVVIKGVKNHADQSTGSSAS